MSEAKWDLPGRFRSFLGAEERRVLVAEVESRVVKALEEARKLMHLRKAETLELEHFNDALRQLGEEPVVGFADTREAAKTKVALMQLLEAPTPPIPAEPSLRWHWLSVDGRQPSVPENPSPADETEALLNVGAVHEMSEEMRAYFDKVTEAVRGALQESPREVKAVWQSLASDQGLQELVPYFCRLVERKVSAAGTPASVILNCLTLLSCLFRNKHLHLNFYLQQIMPVVLTCVVRRQIGAKGDPTHFRVRKDATILLCSLCDMFAHQYPTLLPRVWKTLHTAVQGEKKPLEANFGGIVGLSAMGPNVTAGLLLPLVPDVLRRFDAIAEKKRDDDAERQLLRETRVALLDATGNHFHSQIANGASVVGRSRVEETKLGKEDFASLTRVFGEALYPYMRELVFDELVGLTVVDTPRRRSKRLKKS